MGTFLAALPSPQPIFAAANDPELSSILAALLAMNNDDDFGELPRADDEFFAADSTALPVPAFFVHQYYQPAAMPFPPVPMPPPPPLAPVHAADHEGTSAGALQPAKRKRGQQKTASSASGSGAENTGQEGVSTRASRRTVWARERSTEWWDHLDGPSCPDAEFRGAFRMSRATFGVLCDALGGAVAKEDTALRAAIPVRQRVAVCLRRLATAEPLSEVSRRFGLGISTCHSIVLQVCHALATVLMPAVIQWPDAATAAAFAARFEAASGLPGVVGAVYTTHVPIVAPKANVVAYYDSRLTERSQKASYSVAVQTVSDADGAFTNVYIGLPGSLSDAAVLGRSALCARRGELGLLGGHGQEQRLVGGASYPLTDWMLVPYAHPNMTGTQNLFNDRIGAARDVARGAVRRLKARWRCLQRRTEAKIQDLPSLIAACCVLHNVCERAGEVLDPDLMQYELDDDEADVAHDAAPPAAAVLARDRIAHGLLHGSHAGE